MGSVQAVFEQPHVNLAAHPPPTSELGKKKWPYLFLKRGVNSTAVAILYGFNRNFVQNNSYAAVAGAAPGHLGVGGLKFGAPIFLKLFGTGA